MTKSIIVEGFDNMGKSTLIESLREYFPKMGLYQAGGPPKTEEEACFCCADQVTSSLKPTIFDRITPISNACYADKMDDQMYRSSLAAMCKRSIVIYCSTEWVEKNHVVKGHDTLDHLEFILKERENICERYDRIMDYISDLTEVVQYDWRHNDELQFMASISRLIG